MAGEAAATDQLSELEFKVVYTGPALASGRMPVRQLAPALLGLGEVFQDANARVNPGQPAVELDFRAAQPGSFEAVLLLWQHDVGQTASLLASPGATALANLITFVTSGTGLLRLLIFRHNKEEVSHREVAPGLVEIDYSDGTKFRAQTAALAAASDVRVLREVRQMAQPLSAPGVEEFRLLVDDPSIPSLSISRPEAPALLELPEGIDLPNVATTVLDLSVVMPVLTDDPLRWRVSDGGRRFTASMLDEDFVQRVAAGVEPFLGGDVLRCLVQIKQVQTPGGELRPPSYEILQVLEHRSNGRLFLPPGAPEDQPKATD